MQKCIYCDFLSGKASEKTIDEYIEALQKEIDLTAKEIDLDNRKVTSIFFGGGTPSILTGEQLEIVVNKLKSIFVIDADAEITVECNPGTVSYEKFMTYKRIGINRISFGLQSADDDELRMLGRIHDYETFVKSVSDAKLAGFSNISADLLMSIPGQNKNRFQENMRRTLSVGLKHISAYSLIIEEGTYLYEHLSDFPELPSEDEDREMYALCEEELDKNGFKRYEISNYAIPGFECRHNTLYWDRGEYLGFGLGAASLFEEKRYSNTRDLQNYLKLNSENANLLNIRTDVESLSDDDQIQEFMFLGLRKICGINALKFKDSFGKNLSDVYGDILEKHIVNGLIEKEGDNYRLTKRGLDISNYVMSDFIMD